MHGCLTREVRYSSALIGFIFLLDALQRMADRSEGVVLVVELVGVVVVFVGISVGRLLGASPLVVVPAGGTVGGVV